jgi:signal peptide peptidase SppA
MLSHKTITALAEHGDIWCLDLSSLNHYLEEGERKRQPRIPKVNGSVAVIPIQGVITKRGGWFSDGLDRIGRALDTAMNSSAIGGVVLDIDSPGGSSYGLMEFADKVFSYRSNPKPLLGVSNPVAASAAFWAGASTDQFIVSPSGDVGSVGVWSLHLDYSEYLAQEGIKPTFVYAGKYKVEGNPFEPLSDEARAEIQRGVDEVYSDFTNALARNRGVTKAKVISDFGEGRVLSANRAKQAGMVDRIASLEEVISSMGGGASGGRSSESTEAERQLVAAWEGKACEEPSGEHVEASKRRRERERRTI